MGEGDRQQAVAPQREKVVLPRDGDAEEFGPKAGDENFKGILWRLADTGRSLSPRQFEQGVPIDFARGSRRNGVNRGDDGRRHVNGQPPGKESH